MQRLAFVFSCISMSCFGGVGNAETIRPIIIGPVHVGAEAVFVKSLQQGSQVHLNYIDADGEKVRLDRFRTAAGLVRFETPSTHPVDALQKDWQLVACAKHSTGAEDICSEPVTVRAMPTRLTHA